jgi:hypothetical protein
MSDKKFHPVKPHQGHHLRLKAQPPQGDDWPGAADALNAAEKYSLDTRGKSITPDEGAELTAAPRVVGDALSRISRPKGP